MAKQSFRKESSFFADAADLMSNLTLTPTSLYSKIISEVDDYEQEVTISKVLDKKDRTILDPASGRLNRNLPMAPVEPLVEFLGAEPVFLSAVALYSKGSAHAAHPGALLDVLTPDKTADEPTPV
jgi:hypothetical protein